MMTAEPVDVDLYDSLEGQVALVTGATRGIGAAIAAQLTDLGASVYAGARDVADISANDQHPIQLDVTNESGIIAAADRIASEAPRLDILVNNAGVFPRSGPLHAMKTSDLDETLAVNLRGPMLVTAHMLPLLLLDREGGRVVNLSSDLGQFTQGTGSRYPPYRISKVGVGGLTAYLHSEYNSQGLLANAVNPGWVRTDMGGPGATRSPTKGAETPVWLARFTPENPSGRFWQDRRLIEW